MPTFRGAEGLDRRRGTRVFHIYVLFLILSGIVMLVLAGVRSGQRPAPRIWSIIFGAAFTIYGLYLLLFFRGGHYLLLYYVFVLPILMIVRFFRDRSAYQAQQQATVFQAQPASGYGQPPGYDQPPSYGQASGYAEPADYGQRSGFDQPYENQPRAE